MALPSAVTLGSLTLVVAAGVGLVVVSSNADEKPQHHQVSHSAVAPSPRAPSTSTRAVTKTAQHPRPRASDAVPTVLVEVFNNSGVTGLAATKAAVLQGAGWNVAATDNWYGNIPANTVYYPAKLQTAARQLAKTLHITRLRPAVSPMQFDRLTVIFTSP
ncbi:MAG: LytR C-terminal domain-containing protein [Nocardioidaceae bacterium]